MILSPEFRDDRNKSKTSLFFARAPYLIDNGGEHTNDPTYASANIHSHWAQRPEQGRACPIIDGQGRAPATPDRY